MNRADLDYTLFLEKGHRPALIEDEEEKNEEQTDIRRGRVHRQSPTDRCLPLTLSVVTAQTQPQTAAPLQWGEELSVQSAGMLVRHHSGGRFVEGYVCLR